MPPSRVIRANRSRLRREFEAQARIGRYGKTGLARVAFTRDYNQVRNLFRGWMEKAGLKTRIDAVGNLFGRKEGRVKGLPPVMTGSHLDSQNPAGRFDGVAGVLTALEAVRRIAETGAERDHSLEIIGFIGEESSCGMPVFGSSVLVGMVGADEMRAAIHPPSGKTVYEAIRAAGGSPWKAKQCLLPKGSVKAFLELHIEQGPVLEAEKIPIGIVDTIVGLVRGGEALFEGTTAHAGGQPMGYRRDAAIAAARFMVAMDAEVRCAPKRERMTLTFGEVSVQPGVWTIVPGAARISFDLRAKSSAAINRMLGRMRKTLERIEKSSGVKGRLRLREKAPPFRCSPGIRRALVKAAENTSHPYIVLSSGGVHDACRMAKICPIGMIFVPSVKGLSHTPAEFTRLSDLVAGAEVLAAALLRLADRGVKA